MGTTPDVDVVAAIADFVRDDARTALEFPPMPAGQRKHVKAIADTYPNLVSESFGMGLERCIHIFKTDANKEGSGSVTVKNTFIDDWVSPAEGDDALEPIIFRSMPSQLSDGAGRLPLQSRLDLSPITEASPFGSPKLSGDAFRMGCGKQADADRSPPNAGGGRTSGDGGLPTLLGSFQAPQVRNTFIHIDTAAPDDRSVQSMPHDMFRQCLQEEMQQQLAASGDKDVTSSATPETGRVEESEATPADVLALGTQVVIQGLTKIPAFNGQSGIIERYDENTERYSVKLTTGGPGIPKYAKVKGANLCVAAPAVLSFSPAAYAAPKGPQAFFGQYGSAGAPLKLTALV